MNCWRFGDANIPDVNEIAQNSGAAGLDLSFADGHNVFLRAVRHAMILGTRPVDLRVDTLAVIDNDQTGGADRFVLGAGAEHEMQLANGGLTVRNRKLLVRCSTCCLATPATLLPECYWRKACGANECMNYRNEGAVFQYTLNRSEPTPTFYQMPLKTDVSTEQSGNPSIFPSLSPNS